MSEQNSKWYVLYTRPRWEKKVDMVLQAKGFQSWCPLQKKEKQWSDRKKIIDEPLFKSYVFVKLTEAEKLEVRFVDGVVNFVFYLKKHAIIREKEIETIKYYLAETDAIIDLQSQEGFVLDTKIMVSHGVFMGKQGKVLQGGKKNVYVVLESLGQVMIVKFPTHHITRV